MQNNRRGTIATRAK